MERLSLDSLCVVFFDGLDLGLRFVVFVFVSHAFISIDSYFTFLTECKNPKACTILLRGASKDILMEGVWEIQLFT